MLVVGVLLLGGCAGADNPLPQPSPPSDAGEHSGGGDLATAVDLTMGDLYSRLREPYEPPWDVQRYSVPAPTRWEAVTTHYAQALGSGWEVDTRYPEEVSTGPYRSKVWTDERRAVAIALNEGPDAGADHVLTVLVPEGDR